MKITFELKLEKLRAMRRFASSEELKYALHGVHVEVGPARQIVMAATDGVRLGSFATPGTISFVPEAAFTIPSELIDAIPVNMRTLRLPLQIDYTDTSLGGVIRVLAGDVELRMPPIAIPYPKWRCVVPDPWPQTFKPEFLSLNMKFFNDFFEAARDLIQHDQLQIAGGGNNHEPIAIRGASPNGEGEFFGVLMPVIMAGGSKTLPELPLWIKS
jgi:hypothetical protein